MSVPAPAQDGPARIGFEGLAADPHASDLFDEVTVTPGPSSRALAHQVSGTEGGTPFVNVLRWVDARDFRGKLIAVRQSARLDAATPGTAARLWVRVLRADGGVAFADDGLDQATTSSEWTTLTSIGGVAEDATDLCFGLLVEGTTPVHIGSFEIEVRGDLPPTDPRHAVPQRWTSDADVRAARAAGPGSGLGTHVTSFVPPGYAVRDLPHLWLLRNGDDLRESYLAGRALLEAMRLGQEPPAIVTLAHVPEGAARSRTEAISDPELVTSLLECVEPELAMAAVHAVARPRTTRTPALVGRGPRGGFHLATAAGEAAGYPELLGGQGFLHAERVHLRWTCAQHDAGRDADLAALLFEASVASMEPWDARPTVGRASHSLEGHDCGHDHSHD